MIKDMERWRKTARTALSMAAAGCFALWLGGLLYAYLSYDSPKELREMTQLRTAWLFAQGENPYGLAMLDKPIPEVTNMYGFLMPLLCGVFLRLFAFLPLSPLQLCQILTVLVEVLGLAAGWYVLDRRCRYRLPAIAGMVYLCCCYWRYTAAGGVFPDQWGLSLSLGLLALADHDEKRGQYHPCLYALGAIALFFIKQYFVFIIFGTFVWLLCRDRRAACRYAVCGIVCGAAAVAAVWFLLPLYFTEAFAVGDILTSLMNRQYSLDQFPYLVKTFAFAGFGIAAALVLSAVAAARQHGGRARLRAAGRGIAGIPYAGWQCLCILPLTVYIAQNMGTIYTYYLQLWCPYYILFGLPLLDGAVYTAVQSRQPPRWRRVLAGAAALLALVTAWRTADNLEQFLRVVPLTPDGRSDWDKAEELLTGYAAKGEILTSAHLSEICMRHGIPTTEYGQAECNTPGDLDGYRAGPLKSMLFPFVRDILQKNVDYNAQLREKIKNRELTCIALTDQTRYWLTDEEIEAAGYHVTETLTLFTGEWEWETKFYVPE